MQFREDTNTINDFDLKKRKRTMTGSRFSVTSFTCLAEGFAIEGPNSAKASSSMAAE